LPVTIEQLETWISSPEGENLEFKEAKTQYDLTKLYRYCIALYNEGGGKLILGVNDAEPRKVVGSSSFPNLNDIKSKIFDKLRIRVDVEEVLHPDGRVVVFHIPPRPPGTALHYEGSYLMRVGEELVPMSPEQLRKIFDEGKPDFLSQIALSNLSSDDVVRLLDTQIYFDLLKMPYPAERKGVLERFASEKLIKKHGSKYDITNLGAILFAKDLNEFESVSRKAPRVVAYEGKSKLKTRIDRFGTRGYVVSFENLIEFIKTLLPSNEVIGKAFREEFKMFPGIAIRELVANALIHQDFNEQGIFVMVEIYSDRMEISNPGQSPIATDRLIDGYQSRNEILADLMRRLRVCERQGSGIDKVIDSIEAWQLPAPDFRNGEKQFTAVLFSHASFSEMSKKDKIRACYQHCCLKFMMNERMTNQSLRERFDLSESKTDVSSQVIRNTMDAGIIKLEDPESTSKRYARYVPYWA
jgi:ATP-dependent DNA helicase RecG